MSSVQPVFPNGTFTWTDRIDGLNVDFANDINSVAAELISVETTFGNNPQIEGNPPVGHPITYPSVSARISDAMNSRKMPVGELSYTQSVVANNNNGQLNNYKATYDPYNLFNGTDLTIQADGWWYISASQSWQGWTDGYSHMSLCLNGTSNVVDEQILNWEFPGNAVIAGVPGRWLAVANATGPSPVTTTPNQRSIITSVSFQGLARVGDRFSVVSENGTSNAAHVVNNLKLKGSMQVAISSSFTSG
jgi:hypothetical protein